jgi:hypothetical protein
LDGVKMFDRAALRDSETGEVHEARHVAAYEYVGVCLENVIEF